LLASCYTQVLRLAAESGVHTLAFPAISCGVYGYPIEQAAKIAVRTIRAEAGALAVQLVAFNAASRSCWSARWAPGPARGGPTDARLLLGRLTLGRSRATLDCASRVASPKLDLRRSTPAARLLGPERSAERGQ